MKTKLLSALLTLAAATYSTAAIANDQSVQQLEPLQQETQAAHMTAQIMSRFNFKSPPADAEMREKLFAHCLHDLDRDKIFFTQADIDQLANQKSALVDSLNKEDLKAPFAIFNLYAQRVSERYSYAKTLLKQDFDFSGHENFQMNREDASSFASDDELSSWWRMKVKNDWLQLKLAGYAKKEIIASLNQRYDNFLERIRKIGSSDVLQGFLNAYTHTIDPHAEYFAPQSSESLSRARASAKFVGIGLTLKIVDGYPTVEEVISGGPAALSGTLKIGDRLTGVSQDQSSPMIGTLGLGIDDVVDMLRGTPGTSVILDTVPAEASLNGYHRSVTLVRKGVPLEEQGATVSIITPKQGGNQIGVITIPSFYQDFNARMRGDTEYKSVTRDVSRLLQSLKQDEVDTVLIDLRNNGGGSLGEAVSLVGLFIGNRPVVQQMDSHGKLRIEASKANTPVWDGQVAVLINHRSAAASEIFAAAMQDYGRGLVLGETSFGDGTVQTIVDLDSVAKNNRRMFGNMKLTVAEFFRVNGDATQLRGVKPDIAILDTASTDKYGESNFDNALPWSQIKPAEYTPIGDLTTLAPMLQNLHEARLKNDSKFQQFKKDIAASNAIKGRKAISLNEAQRRKELNAEIEWVNRLVNNRADKTQDMELNEALQILDDEVELLRKDAAIAKKVRGAAQAKAN